MLISLIITMYVLCVHVNDKSLLDMTVVRCTSVTQMRLYVLQMISARLNGAYCEVGLKLI